MSRFEAIGRFVYENGNRIEEANDVARKLNAYQMRIERFKAEVERLRKAGDNLARAADENGCHDNGDAKDLDDSIDRWYAAKDGKPSV